MNILIFNWRDLTHPWAGGAEVFLHEVSRRWMRQGHRVTWFCGRHENQPDRECIEGIEIIRRGGIYSVYLHAALYYLSRLRDHFDVLFDSANGIPFFTPLFSTIPKVVMVHHVHHEVFFRELPWHLAHLANALESIGLPLVYRRTRFVTVSDSSRRALIDLGVPATQISVLHNGVDCASYRPGPKSKVPLVVYLGRLRYYKSIDVAIRALPGILRAVPDLCFSIVGSGMAETSLRALAQELGVADHVRFHGYVSETEKIRLLQQAHVVVNTSMKEGWGLTMLEANACGTPVVGADVPGLCDSVQHGKTGMLVPYGDPVALAESVRDLLLDHGRRERMEENALAWAALFDWDQAAQRCLHILACCQAERRRAR
jgi:glycosyltransferase involved in cell wall biosynthesis